MHEIVNDLATDTVNVNSLIHEANDSKSELMNYLSYFEKGNIPIEKVISSSISLTDKRNSYLGNPDDFFEKL